jgi:hypothetical protein
MSLFYKWRRHRSIGLSGLEDQMIGVRVTITRYVSDEPQPGLVECQFLDAHGRRWSFIEKTAVVSMDHLDAHSVYHRPGVIAGEVVRRGPGAAGREVVRIDTESPWGVESVDGVTRFEILPESLVEWEWGSDPTPPAADPVGRVPGDKSGL